MTGVSPCARIVGQPTSPQCLTESSLEQSDLPLLPTSTRQGATTRTADRIPDGGSKPDDNCTAFPFWKTWKMMLSLRCSAERTGLFTSKVVGFFSENFQEKLDSFSFLGGTLTISF